MATSKTDTTRIWAGSAAPANIEDPDVTSPGKFSAGWVVEKPPFQNFNFLQKQFTEVNAYINEQGIGVWDAVTTYPIGGIAKGSNNKLYIAVLEQAGNNPTSDDGTNWLLFLSSYADVKSGRRNEKINGDFSVWQRGVTFTTNLGYAADTYRIQGLGSTAVTTQQNFTEGQTVVPGNPRHYMRCNVTSALGANNYLSIQTHLDNVEMLAGKEITLSFWAKADGNKNISSTFTQTYGAGGSGNNGNILTTVHSLTTSWQKFTVTGTIDSISGKTIGTDGADSLILIFWLDADSVYDPSAGGIGQQSIICDIAQLQIEVGGVATDFDKREYNEELALCKTRYEKSYNDADAPGAATSNGAYLVQLGSGTAGNKARNTIEFSTKKRITPTVSYYAVNGTASQISVDGSIHEAPVSGSPVQVPAENGAQVNFNTTTSGEYATFHWVADAEY